MKHHFAYYAIEYGAQWHKEFAQALNATGRPVFLEVVAGYWFLKHETADYANSWRFCEDHHDDYESTAEAVCVYLRECIVFLVRLRFCLSFLYFSFACLNFES